MSRNPTLQGGGGGHETRHQRPLLEASSQTSWLHALQAAPSPRGSHRPRVPWTPPRHQAWQRPVRRSPSPDQPEGRGRGSQCVFGLGGWSAAGPRAPEVTGTPARSQRRRTRAEAQAERRVREVGGAGLRERQAKFRRDRSRGGGRVPTAPPRRLRQVETPSGTRPPSRRTCRLVSQRATAGLEVWPSLPVPQSPQRRLLPRRPAGPALAAAGGAVSGRPRECRGQGCSGSSAHARGGEEEPRGRRRAPAPDSPRRVQARGRPGASDHAAGSSGTGTDSGARMPLRWPAGKGRRAPPQPRAGWGSRRRRARSGPLVPCTSCLGASGAFRKRLALVVKGFSSKAFRRRLAARSPSGAHGNPGAAPRAGLEAGGMGPGRPTAGRCLHRLRLRPGRLRRPGTPLGGKPPTWRGGRPTAHRHSWGREPRPCLPPEGASKSPKGSP